MKIKYATISKTGRRSNNEDCFNVLEMPEPNRFMGIVCDGMGGHSFGEVASEVVCDAISKYWQDNTDTPDSDKKVVMACKRLVMPSTRNPMTSAMQRWVLRWSWPALKVTRRQ